MYNLPIVFTFAKCPAQAFSILIIHLLNSNIMSEYPQCPKCQCEFTYPSDNLFVCSECFHEWNPEEAEETDMKVLDANGNVLQNGDTVIIIKDLPVKGAPRPIKLGTKVKNIRLTDGDHNIDCKIDGFGAMGLKSEFVKKA
jgi:protein PhnA